MPDSAIVAGAVLSALSLAQALSNHPPNGSRLGITAEFLRHKTLKAGGALRIVLHNPGRRAMYVHSLEVFGLGFLPDPASVRNAATRQHLHLPFLLRPGASLHVVQDLSLRRHRLPGPLPLEILVQTEHGLTRSHGLELPVSAMAASRETPRRLRPLAWGFAPSARTATGTTPPSAPVRWLAASTRRSLPGAARTRAGTPR